MIFFKKNKGSITLFMTIIVLALITVAGIVVDACRIREADTYVQEAGDSAGDSVLSGYNSKLLDLFGLFAIDTSGDSDQDSYVQSQFQKYFTSTLNTSQQNNGDYIDNATNKIKNLILPSAFNGKNLFNLFQFTDTTVSAKGMYNLADPEVLNDQIVEYMKYRAPYKFIMNLQVDDMAKDFEEESKEAKLLHDKIVLDDMSDKFKNQYMCVYRDIDLINLYTTRDMCDEAFKNLLEYYRLLKQIPFDEISIDEEEEVQPPDAARIKFFKDEEKKDEESRDSSLGKYNDMKIKILRYHNFFLNHITEPAPPYYQLDPNSMDPPIDSGYVGFIADAQNNLKHIKKEIKPLIAKYETFLTTYSNGEYSEFSKSAYYKSLNSDGQKLDKDNFEEAYAVYKLLLSVQTEYSNIKDQLAKAKDVITKFRDSWKHETDENFGIDSVYIIKRMEIKTDGKGHTTYISPEFMSQDDIKKIYNDFMDKNYQEIFGNGKTPKTPIPNLTLPKDWSTKADKSDADKGDKEYKDIKSNSSNITPEKDPNDSGILPSDIPTKISNYPKSVKSTDMSTEDKSYVDNVIQGIYNNQGTIDGPDNTAETDAIQKAQLALADASFKKPSWASQIIDDIVSFFSSNPDPTFGEKSFGGLSGLYSEITSTLKEGRDAVYVNEYIMYTFKNRVTDIAVNSTQNDHKGTHDDYFRVPDRKYPEKDLRWVDKSVRQTYFKNAEVEYILKGHNSEELNKLMVYKDIYLIRMVVNTSHIYSTVVDRNQAAALGLAIATAAMQPELEDVLKWIIITAWSAAESVVDMNQLDNGYKIYLFKKADQYTDGSLNVTIANIPNIIKGKSRVPVYDKGIPIGSQPPAVSYEDYLRIFLFLEDRDRKLGRVADLIQLNMQKEGVSNFEMKDANTYVRADVTTSLKYLFMSQPFIKNVTHSLKNDTYNIRKVIYKGY